MRRQSSVSSPIQYFRCTKCGRRIASSYGDDLVRTGTATRIDNGQTNCHATDDFEQIKERLARWLSRLDERDPYRVLGVPTSANKESIKARFKELAFENHPDRGGDPVAMRRLLNAYALIRDSNQ